MDKAVSPRQLYARLALYFAVLFSAIVVLMVVDSPALRWLLPGGTDVPEMAEIEVSREVTGSALGKAIVSAVPVAPMTGEQRQLVIVCLAISLALTAAIMMPITWTYKATRREAGFRKTFVRALLVLPVCATTIVLLIQDSLALAFGLAALVAAVGFRVALQNPIDGIYIFAAICVALAAGIGYLGIAMVMATFFCFANALLWHLDYGRNPLDDARAAKDLRKPEIPGSQLKKGSADR